MVVTPSKNGGGAKQKHTVTVCHHDINKPSCIELGKLGICEAWCLFLKKVWWGVAAVDLEDRSCGRRMLVTL